jgi:hypothetical protein
MPLKDVKKLLELMGVITPVDASAADQQPQNTDTTTESKPSPPPAEVRTHSF